MGASGIEVREEGGDDAQMPDVLARIGGESVAAARIERLAGIGERGAAVDAVMASVGGLASAVRACHAAHLSHPTPRTRLGVRSLSGVPLVSAFVPRLAQEPRRILAAAPMSG